MQVTYFLPVLGGWSSSFATQKKINCPINGLNFKMNKLCSHFKSGGIGKHMCDLAKYTGIPPRLFNMEKCSAKVSHSLSLFVSLSAPTSVSSSVSHISSSSRLVSPWLLNRVVVCFGRGSISNSPSDFKKVLLFNLWFQKGTFCDPKQAATSPAWSAAHALTVWLSNAWPSSTASLGFFVCAFEIWPRRVRSLCLCVYRPQPESWNYSRGHQNNPRSSQSCSVSPSSSPQQRYTNLP